MKRNRFILILVVLFTFLYSLMSFTFAINTNDAFFYYDFDSDVLDSSTNANDGTAYGSPSYTSGKLGQAIDFDGSNDHILFPDTGWQGNTQDFSITMWVQSDSADQNKGLLSFGNEHYYHVKDLTGEFVTYHDGGWKYISITNALSTNHFEFVTVTYSQVNGTKIYINGVQEGSNADTGAFTTVTLWNNSIGAYSANRFDGKIDEVGLWNKTLTTTEISELYNANVSYNPFALLPTPQIQLNISNGDYFNVPLHNISLNTTTNVNMSYYKNTVLIKTINNTNFTTLIINLSEGSNNLSFKSVDISGTNWNNITVTLDTQPANVSVNNFTEWNDGYNVTTLNTTLNITCEDPNLAVCEIHWDDNTTTNLLTTQHKLFSTNGNHTFTLHSHDLANNTADANGTIFINPSFNVNFLNSTGALITNFTINSTNYTNNFSGNTYDYGLGTHTFLFAKNGFNSTTFQLTFNLTTDININLSVPGAKIIISIYDITDYGLINGSNTSVEIIGSSFSQSYETSSGYVNISSLTLEEETYTLIVSNPNFETVTTAFNFDNQEIININVYMTPLNVTGETIADIIVRVVDDYQSPLRNFVTIQYVWDSGQSEYVQNNYKFTDYNGETSFKVFLNTKLYNFCAQYQNVLYCEEDKSININTQEVVIEIPLSELEVFDDDSIYDVDFAYTLTNTSVGNMTSITFSYNNPNQNIDEYCLSIYEILAGLRTLQAQQCSNNHIGGLSVNIFTNTSKNYVAVATIELDSDIRELDSLYLYVTYDLKDEFDKYGLFSIILIGLLAFVIGVAVHKKVHDVTIAHFGLPLIYLILYIPFRSYISFESVILVMLVNFFAWKIVTMKDDINKTKTYNTLTSVLMLYMVFIFGLHTALTEMDNKGFLDDYGDNLLNNIDDDNSFFDNYINTSTTNLKSTREGANVGAWELLTGIFLKTLEFVDLFFSILSNLFSIASNLFLIIGVSSELLLKFVQVLDFGIVSSVIYLYFKEAFK